MREKIGKAMGVAREAALVARDAAAKLTVPRIFWPSALAVVFLSSLAVWGFTPMRRSATLFFPLARDGSRQVAELRYAVPARGREGNVARVIEELFLGPVDETAVPLAPAGTDVRVIRGKSACYVDIGEEFLLYAHEPSASVTARRSLELVRRTLEYNFPGVDFVVTVDGREPEWAPREAPETALPAKAAPVKK